MAVFRNATLFDNLHAVIDRKTEHSRSFRSSNLDPAGCFPLVFFARSDSISNRPFTFCEHWVVQVLVLTHELWPLESMNVQLNTLIPMLLQDCPNCSELSPNWLNVVLLMRVWSVTRLIWAHLHVSTVRCIGFYASADNWRVYRFLNLTERTHDFCLIPKYLLHVSETIAGTK